MNQKYKSSTTSINSTKVPALFRKQEKYGLFEPFSHNLDYGGGKYDTATNYLDLFGVVNHVYDPYNRSDRENQAALAKTDYDTATLSNVLNVIAEKEIRLDILRTVKEHLKNEGALYITVYEGTKSGIASFNEKRDSYQLNKKLVDYLAEIKEVFENAYIEHGMIICERK